MLPVGTMPPSEMHVEFMVSHATGDCWGTMQWCRVAHPKTLTLYLYFSHPTLISLALGGVSTFHTLNCWLHPYHWFREWDL